MFFHPSDFFNVESDIVTGRVLCHISHYGMFTLLGEFIFVPLDIRTGRRLYVIPHSVVFLLCEFIYVPVDIRTGRILFNTPQSVVFSSVISEMPFQEWRL